MTAGSERRIVDDVPRAFAALVESTFAAQQRASATAVAFRLGCSGGASGKACHGAVAASEAIDWSKMEYFFADERCVDPESPDSNQRLLREVYGDHIGVAAGFFPMSCSDGPAAYDRLLADAGRFHLLQLGLGPDGHTASLFPGSEALSAPEGLLVVENTDPTGNNPHQRLTLTYSGIAHAELVVITVIGADKQQALSAIDAGADLPARRVHADRVVWLIDAAAAGTSASTV